MKQRSLLLSYYKEVCITFLVIGINTIAVMESGILSQSYSRRLVHQPPAPCDFTSNFTPELTPNETWEQVDFVSFHEESYTVQMTDQETPLDEALDEAPNETEDELDIRSQGQPRRFQSIPEPVFVMFGNDGFRDMLANFICNMRIFPPVLRHTLFIVTDERTRAHIDSFGTEASVWLVQNPLQDPYDFETPNYMRLMLFRGECLTLLLGSKAVVWLEPDANYHQNLLLQPEMTAQTDEFSFTWDNELYAGNFMRFPADPSAKTFYGEVMNRMRLTTLSGGVPTINDQNILTAYIKEETVKYTVLDECKYRSGFYFQSSAYQDRCKGVRPVVQQHNWMIGAQTKVDFAKSHNGWYLGDNALQCKQRDIRLVVMTMDRPKSLNRLMESLKAAPYPPGMTVDLQITADIDSNNSLDKETSDYLCSVAWSQGFLETRPWPRHMGLLGQWMEAWPCEEYPSDLYRAVIMLEDDLEVAPYYFEWFLAAHETYRSPRVGAVTGMRPSLVAKEGNSLAMTQLVPSHGVHAFAYKLMATWSLSPKYEVWKRFRAWYSAHKHEPPEEALAVDGIVPWQWYKHFIFQQRTDRMWEMWYIKFTDLFDLYTVYPWVDSGERTLVCNWKEKGLNFNGWDLWPDFPLNTAPVLNSSLIRQCPLPYVEWDAVFSDNHTLPCEFNEV